MYPTGPALDHPAAADLLQFGTTGCPVDCGTPWTQEQIQDAIDYAAHPSAQDAVAAKCLRTEALEKVEQGFADIVPWEEIKNDHSPHLKVSPIAACLLYTSDAADE